ncbi:hypothetical protein G436_1578 [Leptospira interrogans serovar Hardjo str. Norma]|uniref:Uncharacterized protein n=1 Tax=Leptospira interrogans serovar Hardjo str. Norma TaxID=1279460 RepID=A0A0M4NIS8_LEPIR|nr:hypothetical protein G436_1578 [Leptospira interrogans serovar Hardjo str. Norma]
MGTTTKLRFVRKTMWELLQITILRTNSKIVGIILLENFFSRTAHVK